MAIIDPVTIDTGIGIELFDIEGQGGKDKERHRQRGSNKPAFACRVAHDRHHRRSRDQQDGPGGEIDALAIGKDLVQRVKQPVTQGADGREKVDDRNLA